MNRRAVMQDLINENIIFEFKDVVPNGWAIVPKTSGLEVGWYFPESLSLWKAAGFVGSYVDMVCYAMLLTIRNNHDPDSFWTYCLAELGHSTNDYLFMCWTPVAWNFKRMSTEEVFEKLYHIRGWYPYQESSKELIYNNPLSRKWVRVGIGHEDHIVTHEPATADKNIIAFPSSRPIPKPAILERHEKRVEAWKEAWDTVLEL